MAKMACYCGASMSNVDCPSENVLYVMNKDRVQSALKYNSQITLIDFITNWDSLKDAKKLFISEDYDFWYCTQCKRVYQSEIKIGGNKLAVYTYYPDVDPIDKEVLFSMQELIVFTDIEEYDATEKDPPTLLADFISSLSAKRYFITDDGSVVYAYDCENECVLFSYHSEELMEIPSSDA
ncbi:MAG: hypothetical protein IJU20_03150 [Clostridia bacterium]|nr:hypothetical protein [Clostridia bacterium]